MTHDFAKQKKLKHQKKKQAFTMPSWLLLSTGIAIGLLASLLFKLSDIGPLKDPKALIPAAEKLKISATLGAEKYQSPQQTKTREGKNREGKNSEVSGLDKELNKFTHKPRFDFYTILPEQEAFVPNINEPLSTDRSSTKAPKSEQAPSPKATFFLQTGSFREYSEAHKLKGELLLAGLNVKIQTVTLNNGETWHRVQVGPFQSERALSKAQNTLARINIDSMVLKQKI